MSFAIRRAALQAARTPRAPVTRPIRRTYADEAEGKSVLQQGAKRDPELYVRIAHPLINLPPSLRLSQPHNPTIHDPPPTQPQLTPLSCQTLMAIMIGAAGLVGWHFSRNPTSSSSENKVAAIEGSEPWKDGGEGKYQYHPGGDTSRGKRDAPSALNEVVVPNVNLPKVSWIVH